MGKFIDLTGRVFERLTVVKRAANWTRRSPYWVCRCRCGTETTVTRSNLVSGATRSCGCLHNDQLAAIGRSNKTHGFTKSSTYVTWTAMKRRCFDVQHKDYSNYGARGITVCARWKNSFEAFLADMGARPRGTSIDRFPNRNGNYEPGNCRWATPSEQTVNRRVTVLTRDLVREIRARAACGETQASIARRMGLDPRHIQAVVSRKSWAHVP